MKNLCDSQRDSETAIPALRRIADLLETEGKDSKDLLQLLGLSKDKHPSPTFSGEDEKVALIWNVKTVTLDHTMLGLVVSTLVSLEKLKRIEKCLCDVISDGRVFILTRQFMPQPEVFPVVQVSQSVEREQHVSNAQKLIEFSGEFLDLVGGCSFEELEMDE